jgi:hypothetical protein
MQTRLPVGSYSTLRQSLLDAEDWTLVLVAPLVVGALEAFALEPNTTSKSAECALFHASNAMIAHLAGDEVLARFHCKQAIFWVRRARVWLFRAGLWKVFPPPFATLMGQQDPPAMQPSVDLSSATSSLAASN